MFFIFVLYIFIYLREGEREERKRGKREDIYRREKGDIKEKKRENIYEKRYIREKKEKR